MQSPPHQVPGVTEVALLAVALLAVAFRPAALGVVSEAAGRDADPLPCGLTAADVASLDWRTLAESLSFKLVIFQRPPE
jgi:hypothetical protein